MDGRWQKGISGNPAGRARGARNKRTIMEEALLAVAAERVAADIVRHARCGDTAALGVLARWTRTRMGARRDPLARD
jgi:hypothetical protein